MMTLRPSVLPYTVFLVVMACQSPTPAPARRSIGGGAVDGTRTGDATLGAKVSYEGGIKTLLEAKCVSCHAKAPRAILTSYADAKKNATASAGQIAKGSMPTSQGGGALAKADQDLFKAWVDGGLLEKAAAVVPPSSTDLSTAVSYEGWAAGFLNDNCVSCHGSGGTKPDLSTYAKARDAADGILSSVESGAMPQKKDGSRGTPIATTKIDKLRAWIDGGTPQADGTVSSDPTKAPKDPTAGGDVTYDSQIKALIATNCLSCHGARKTAPDLSTKSGALANAQAIVGDVAGSGRHLMPTSGALADEDVQTFKSWLVGGTL